MAWAQVSSLLSFAIQKQYDTYYEAGGGYKITHSYEKEGVY